ncbi:MAG: dethiobiotin synthase [Chthoniobacteraceae bacterium]
MRLFITGTDTGVGKTYVTARLVRSLRARGLDCVGMKPISCGGLEDADALMAACDGLLSLDDVNPVRLASFCAPIIAAKIENRPIDLDLIRRTYARLAAAHESIIVEGAGGWLVPLTRDFFIADLAVELALPVIVVAANRLGAINHTLLTVESIQARGLSCAGIILNQARKPTGDDEIAIETNRAVLEETAGVPVLGVVAHGQVEFALTW